MPIRHRRPVVAAALALLLPLTLVPLGGCSIVGTTSGSEEDVDPELATFYGQSPDWEPCADNTSLDCATVAAPLDWSEPDGDSIELALVRASATGTKIGTVFVNPGGPGGSGVDWIVNGGPTAAVTSDVLEHFDLISWDPRGVGASSAVDCGTDAELDHFFYDIDPTEPELGTDAWFDWANEQDAEFAAACEAGTGELLGHISTEDSARDLDMLRAIARSRTLTYVGYSYGTLLGATYAELFPERAGRMVLDGAVDPAEDYVTSAAEQTAAFDAALESYLGWCLTQSDCPFSGGVDDALALIQRLYDALDASPLLGADGRELGSDTMEMAVDAMLYDEDNWTYLSQGFAATLAGDPTMAFALADYYTDRDESGHYASNLMVAFSAIMCLDYEAQATPDEVRAALAADGHDYLFADEAPGYAAMDCNEWPYPASREAGPIAASGSGDILVLGTTGDPATPYASSVALAEELDNGHLVTRSGEGHTAYDGGNSCIDATVDAFLLEGTVPASDPQC
ncbi:MAG: alpha/beta hydrolase [Microbacteriaceae bacterium]